ncbi:protein ENHANCED DOWNY MILDEW 2-like isoform X3 [Prosopis cineraria]|uniref:protein ENHANCED DOWNY MILDEW 2-like isoform X3 n=1 Tax=Prosopis cineraria TaxID=364024 RepID=UPI00240EAD66|nr:protein ENHANCED DOWNY MILDEW 2-like isoform X3 [Prosopis cineraria]
MASSDEEGEIIPVCVDNYYFIDDKYQPVSLSILPLHMSMDEIRCDSGTTIYLRGTADGGLKEIFKQIIAWKFELSSVQPEISVLSKDKVWITLQRPRESFESIIRTFLVTLYWLHFVRRNPEESRISVWKNLKEVFSSSDVKPSENDIRNHVSLIREAAERDKDFAKSEYLLTFIKDPWCNEVFREDHSRRKSKFIVDSEEDADDSTGEESNVDGNHYVGSYDTVCAICDNGGEILPCEGKCLRSFHATIDAGLYMCESLGYTRAEVDAIPKFFCANCKYKLHQCFVCGKLGSSDESSNAEVFRCIVSTCGRYYHPECVAELLSFGVDSETEEIRKNIASGKSFMCPLHKCSLCRKVEGKNVHDLQFAMCRRCPKAYHRKCLPSREITFTGIDQRAWEGLLDGRILMYCMDHHIVRELGTPIRNHLVFPDEERIKNEGSYNLLLSKEKAATSSRQEDITARKTIISINLPELVTETGGSIRNGGSAEIIDKCFRQDISFSSRSIRFDAARKYLNDEKRFIPDRSPQQKLSGGRIDKIILEKTVVKKAKTSHQLANTDMRKRILSLIERSTAAFKEEEFKKSQLLLVTNSCFSETALDKNLTEGKVEGSIKAIQTALQMLEGGGGGCIEDAKAICEPGVLNQLFIWQRQLKVYLAPFLHCKRYTSFGRHFTKFDKLKEVVDRLHCYVQSGDTIVDFCCGSNDFSCLMKSKLDQMGKFCLFKNYDIFQSKNDFCFEKRDWMSVNMEELPNGSQLIMGLNPPFGVNGFLANKFIDKALEFKPKLLILIVPKVTKRLDRKKVGYNLIWEDDEVLSGKSFYLPGSVDIHNKQMEDWNLKPPPLYLWSHPDWTARHTEIALRHGHIKGQDARHMTGLGYHVNNYLMEENHDCYQHYSGLHAPDDVCTILDGIPEDNGDAALPDFARDNNGELFPPRIGMMGYIVKPRK